MAAVHAGRPLTSMAARAILCLLFAVASPGASPVDPNVEALANQLATLSSDLSTIPAAGAVDAAGAGDAAGIDTDWLQGLEDSPLIEFMKDFIGQG